MATDGISNRRRTPLQFGIVLSGHTSEGSSHDSVFASKHIFIPVAGRNRTTGEPIVAATSRPQFSSNSPSDS